MRAFLITALGVATLAAPLPAAESGRELQACRHYADMAYRSFQQRDQGRSEPQQLEAWQKIPPGTANRDHDLERARAMLDYAYGPDGRKLTPTQARTQFFRGCRQASEMPVAPAAVGR